MPPYQRQGRGRRWTNFELNAVLALICKGDHLKQRSTLGFATKLNEALNGRGSKSRYDQDIDVDDVRDLLADLEQHNKAALDFIERQRGPHVVTRKKKLVFMRGLHLVRAKQEEWLRERRRRDQMTMDARLRDQMLLDVAHLHVDAWWGAKVTSYEGDEPDYIQNPVQYTGQQYCSTDPYYSQPWVLPTDAKESVEQHWYSSPGK